MERPARRSSWSNGWVRAWASLLLVVGVWASSTIAENPQRESELKKRQIYREAVLPALGGVIPQSAFTKQRLHHNVHDQLGIEAPDGIVFIPRSPQHQHADVDPEDEKEILHLVPPDGETALVNPHTDPHGVLPKRTLATTYLIRRPTTGHVYLTKGPRFRQHPKPVLPDSRILSRAVYGIPTHLPYKTLQRYW
ncbi:uncharacterized protein [Procambarus clarkii]|uniref:uncharacterized protein n=1 Tax=Procambarus clarkii TaxID=6728 RepID=UPI0037421A5A